MLLLLKFIYSEKTTKFCEISILNLTTVHTVKSQVEISQNFVAFSEYMNFSKFQVNKARRFFKNMFLSKDFFFWFQDTFSHLRPHILPHFFLQNYCQLKTKDLFALYEIKKNSFLLSSIGIQETFFCWQQSSHSVGGPTKNTVGETAI